MPLQNIDEDAVLDSHAAVDNGSRPLGHRTIYGNSSEDNTSTFSHSTNSTASNLPGPGRVLGNFYRVTGKRLERTLGDLAHKAGFSPEAIYQQISALYLEDWKTDRKKASVLKNLCFKLLKQTNSIADSTRFRAIMRWRDILRDQHEIYVRLFFNRQERMIKHASALLRVIEELQSTIVSDFQDAVLSETSFLVDFHSVGLNVINLDRAGLLVERGNFLDWTGATDIHREETEKWDLSLQYLLKSLLDPTVSELSRWYIDFWSSQIVQGNMHVSFALQSCRTLQCVLEAVAPSNVDRWDTLAVPGKKMHEYFVGKSHSRVLLLAQWDDFLLCDGVPVHMSTILNSLAKAYNNVFSSQLDIVPDLNCITMLGSTDYISADVKEKIRGFLNDLQSDDEGKDKAFTKMMFLRSCYRLLRRALLVNHNEIPSLVWTKNIYRSELDDTDCFNKLSNATSFTSGSSGWAVLQLVDILQSLPEVYMLMITLGGDEIKDSVQSLRQSLNVSDNSTSTLDHYPAILIDLRSLLACHASGLRLGSEDLRLFWPLRSIELITRTAPSINENLREVRELFVPYLMDNVTFDPLVFYLKYCISQVWRYNYEWYYEQSLLSCSIVQGALLMEKSISKENRSAMEELCRSMQNSIIDRLRSTGNIDRHIGYALRCLYTDLTRAKHIRTFESEAEVYLSQLCNLCFEIISKKNMWSERDAIINLSDFFEPRNVFGWFLSIRGPDAEKCISRLLEDIYDSQILDTEEVQYFKWRFSHLETHKLGVELLAPRHEKLHFEGAALTKHLSTTSAGPPLTPVQRKIWINAFKSLAANLSSTDPDLMDISIFYFANCPLPYEEDPMLDTALALEYCEKLQSVLSEDGWFESTDKNVKPDERSLEVPWGNQESWNIDESTIKENLSRAVSHIHTCLTKRVECVQQSCMDLAFYQAPTFDGAPLDVPKVVKLLNGLAKSCEENLGADAPELLSPPDY